MTATDQSRRTKRAEIAVLLAGATWFGLLANRGVNVMDEGVIYLHALQTARGLVIYRDYLFPAGPLSIFIQAALIRLFGFHLIVGRVYVALQGLALTAVALSIGRRRLDWPFSLVPAVLWIFYTVALGGFPHYNVDSGFFYALCLFGLDHWLERPRPATLAAAALAGAGAALCKQSLLPAVALTMAGAVFLAGGTASEKLRRILLAAAAMAAAALPFFVYLAANHALGETVAVFRGLGPMKRVMLLVLLPRAAAMLAAVVGAVWLLTVSARRRTGLWPAAAWGLVLAAAAALLIAPNPVAAALVTAGAAVSLLLLVRPDGDFRPWFLLRAGWLLFFGFTAASGLDLGHILIASGGAVFSAGLLLQQAFRRGRPVRIAAACGLAAAVAAGAWLDLALPHLGQSQPPRWQCTQPVRRPGLEGIRTSREQAKELEGVVGFIQSHTRPDDLIFVYPWDLILYSLSGRLPATYHTSFYYEMIDQRGLRRVFADLERNRPRYAVVRVQDGRIFRVAFDSEAGPLEQYLEQRYRVVARFGAYQVMERI